jgi:hypothetical protein
MNMHYSIPEAEMLTKHDATVIKMKERIDREYADGRTTIMSDGELESIALECSGGKYGLMGE